MYKTALGQSWIYQVYIYKSMILLLTSSCVSAATKWIPSDLVKPQSTMSCVKVVFELNEISVQLI